MIKYFADFGVGVILFMGFLIKNSSINDDLFAQISLISSAEKRFENIFDNIEEPVIIFEA